TPGTLEIDPPLAHERVQLRRREDSDDARHAGSRRNVDGRNRPARDIAADEGRVQYAGQGDVVHEGAAPGKEPRVLVARDTLSDESRRAARRRRVRVRHDDVVRSAASRTALTIPW